MACMTRSNLVSRSEDEIFKCSIHNFVQLQNPSIPYSPRLTSAAISGVDLPNPITQLKVGSITSSHASCLGRMRSWGLTAKQPRGSFWLPIGMDCGRLAVSKYNRERRVVCVVSWIERELDAPVSEIPSAEIESRISDVLRVSMSIMISLVPGGIWEDEALGVAMK